MAYITKKAKENAATRDNQAVKWGLYCLNCCLMCFERFIKFLTEQGYIRMALTGSSFCTSCIGALKTSLLNIDKYTMVNGLGGGIVMVGKVLVGVLTAWIGYIITKNSDVKHQLVGYILPVIAYYILGHIIASVFLSIYDTATEAILQCFLLDEKLTGNRAGQGRGGKGVTSHRCPPPLREFFAQNS